MCDPASLALAGTTVASGVAGHVGQQKQADAVAESAQNTLDRRTELAKQRAAEQGRQRSEEGRRERARLYALAGENGVSGPSVAAQQQVSQYKQGTDRVTIGNNAERQIDNATTQAQNAVRRNPGPSWLNTGLQIGSSLGSNPAIQGSLSDTFGGSSGGVPGGDVSGATAGKSAGASRRIF